MAHVSFEQFIKLVEFDQQNTKLEKELSAIDGQIVGHQQAIEHLEQKLRQFENDVKHARLVVKEKEAEMAALEEQAKRKDIQLSQASTQKQHLSVTHELEAVKKAQYAFEEELVAVWQQLDAVVRALKLFEQDVAVQRSKIVVEIEHLKSRAEKLKEEIVARSAERTALLVGVPPELLEKYGAFHGRLPNPVVPVAHGSCSACFETVPNPTMAKLRARVLEQCRNCSRFLYLGSA